MAKLSWTFCFLLPNQGTIVCEHLDHFHPFCMQYLYPLEYIPHSLFLCEEFCTSFIQDLLGQTCVSRSLSSMIYLNYNEYTSVREVYGNVCVFFLLNLNVKNMILTYTKGFDGKNGQNQPDFFRKNNSRSPNLYDKFQQVLKNIEGFCFFSTFISNLQPNLAKSSYG